MPRDETPELQGEGGKLRYLLDDADPRAVAQRTSGKPVTSFTTLAAALGQQSHTAFLANPLSEPNEVRIAQLYGIPIDSECWSEFQVGSCADFIDEYRELAKDLINKLDETRSVRDTGLPIMPGDDRPPERCEIRGLASIELTCGQTLPGQTDLGARISCGISPVDPSPYPITVHVALLEVDCGMARAAEDTIKGFTTAEFTVNGSRGEVRGCWNGGDTQRLAWLLDAHVSSLGVLVFEPGELARIQRIAPGDVIVGTLGTWLKNVSVDETSALQPADEIMIVDRRGEPVNIPSNELTAVQMRVMEHLRKSALDVDGAGFAVLARHELQFVKRPA